MWQQIRENNQIFTLDGGRTGARQGDQGRGDFRIPRERRSLRVQNMHGTLAYWIWKYLPTLTCFFNNPAILLRSVAISGSSTSSSILNERLNSRTASSYLPWHRKEDRKMGLVKAGTLCVEKHKLNVKAGTSLRGETQAQQHHHHPLVKHLQYLRAPQNFPGTFKFLAAPT